MEDAAPCSSGGEALVRTLVANGCNVCFTNPGTSEMHFCKAVDDTVGMRSVLCLFEGVATGACIGYGGMMDKPACCLMHLSGGLTNGGANLHNAKRSCAPTIVICGDHATDHQYDQHLQGPIVPIASAFSHMVRHNLDEMALVRDTCDCIRASMQAPGNVATLVLPANTSWNPKPPLPVQMNAPPQMLSAPWPVADSMVEKGLKMLQDAKAKGTANRVLLLHGLKTLREEGLIAAAKIEKAIGCKRFAPTFNARVARGPGLPRVDTLPYFSEQQKERLKDIDLVLMVNAKHPAGFFGYPEGGAGGPGWVLHDKCQVIELASYQDDGVDLLQRMAARLGASDYDTVKQNRPTPEDALGKDPTQPLDARGIGRIMAAHLPENFILANEGATMGGAVIAGGKFNEVCRFDELGGSVGGAIGGGLPVALGASVACPDRKVICLESDGSAMYTIQALWSMDRENADVCTVVLDNGGYAILQVEYGRMTGSKPGEKAAGMFDLHSRGGRMIDFANIAEGQGVPAVKCHTFGEFQEAFKKGVSTKGPYLIQAVVRPQPKSKI